MRILDMPTTWRSSLSGAVRKAGNAGDEAKEWAEEALDHQAEEGILEPSEAKEAKKALNSDKASGAIKHLGAHTALSVPLRFPLGSIARFLWTVAFRAKAEVMALFGRMSRRQLKAARRLHSVSVAMFSAVPGVGAFAYVASEPIRRNRPLAAALLDETLRKLPLGLYGSQHLASLTRYLKSEPAQVDAGVVLEHRPVVVSIAAVMTWFALFVVTGFAAANAFPPAGIYIDNWSAFLLITAGLMGCLRYFVFWRQPGADDSPDAPLNFFWGLAGLLALWHGLDSALGLSEEISSFLSSLPLLSAAIFELAAAASPLAGAALLVIFFGLLLRHAADSLLTIIIAVALLGISVVLKAALGEGDVASIRDALGLAASIMVMAVFGRQMMRVALAEAGSNRTDFGRVGARYRSPTGGNLNA
jgi:hypothetical protein